MLDKLKSINKKARKIVGRGIGSGKGGHTVGKGTKGHKSRSGYKEPRPGFEGGQMPLARRLSKLKGFSRRYLQIKEAVESVTLQSLNIYETDTVVDFDLLKKSKLISQNCKSVKVVLKGSITKKLSAKSLAFSKKAAEEFLKLGGEIM